MPSQYKQRHTLFMNNTPTSLPPDIPKTTESPQELPTFPKVTPLTLHIRSWDLHALESQPVTKHSVSRFDKAYYFTSPPLDTSPIYNPFYNNIARNLCHGVHVRTKSRFVVNRSANRHMCNSKHLFISIAPYPGKNKHVTLRNRTTICKIQGIGTMDITLPNKSKLRFHHVIYGPTLNVYLFSIKQHIRYTGCFEHSQNIV